MAATTTGRGRAYEMLNAGFSLIELLVVVAIILIIAAIAIPNFMRARMAANEAAAASNVRTVTTAAVIYSTTWGNGYPPLLATLGGVGLGASCNQANLIDGVLASGQKTGYAYVYAGQGPTVIAPPGCGAPGYEAYLVSAKPITPGVTGTRSFCSDEPGVIHYDIAGAAINSVAACAALPALQ
ncbi:MAG TPA: prepilin-type N-terminal cleavage/methylation domain-containing protein [Candidatus Acidoferrales bacterium]|nr:prepilin-type N-terminal cleavage/methylation domain-containing protein [Candidatus Acidoferrales bacterium]